MPEWNLLIWIKIKSENIEIHASKVAKDVKNKREWEKNTSSNVAKIIKILHNWIKYIRLMHWVMKTNGKCVNLMSVFIGVEFDGFSKPALFFTFTYKCHSHIRLVECRYHFISQMENNLQNTFVKMKNQ